MLKKMITVFLYCFKKPEAKLRFTCHNIYLKIITKKECLNRFPKDVDYYNNLTYKVKQNFGHLGQELKLEGFDFLWKEFIVKDKLLSPIICAIEGKEIIGAIGPLDILEDAWGILQLLPPYFGVEEKLRKKGYGEELWKAAMNLAYQKGAKYVLVQSVPNSPAAHFYEKQGLVKRSEIYSVLLE